MIIGRRVFWNIFAECLDISIKLSPPQGREPKQYSIGAGGEDVFQMNCWTQELNFLINVWEKGIPCAAKLVLEVIKVLMSVILPNIEMYLGFQELIFTCIALSKLNSISLCANPSGPIKIPKCLTDFSVGFLSQGNRIFEEPNFIISVLSLLIFACEASEKAEYISKKSLVSDESLKARTQSSANARALIVGCPRMDMP